MRHGNTFIYFVNLFVIILLFLTLYFVSVADFRGADEVQLKDSCMSALAKRRANNDAASASATTGRATDRELSDNKKVWIFIYAINVQAEIFWHADEKF